MTLSPWENELVGEISVDRLMETTRTIAQWVRLSGSEQEMRSINYVRALLDEYGFTTEVIMHDAYISLPGHASIVLSDGTSLPCITHSFGAPTGPEGLAGQIVARASDSLENVRGKIVLLEGLAMPGRVQEGEAAGAIAQIYVNGPITHEMILSPVWGNPTPDRRALLPHTPVLSVTDEEATSIHGALGSGKCNVRVHAYVETGWRKTPILTATLTVPTSADFVLFSGHIDSWYHGAMDNGSANATMIEVARLISQHRETLHRGLRLALWSGHSHGRYSGSAWYADNHWFDLHRHCVAHVNVDSLGGQGATVLDEAIASASTRGLGAEIIEAIAGTQFRGGRVSRAGDQSFIGHGVPFLWMTLSQQPPSHNPASAAFGRLVGAERTGGLGWWWHTTEDTVDKIDPELLLRDAKIYLAGVARLLCSKLLPLSAEAEAGEFLAFLRQCQDECGERFDLLPALHRAEKLVRETKRLDAWRRNHGDKADEGHCMLFNQMTMNVVRSLLPVNYTASGPFDHDPALTMPPIPLLRETSLLSALPPDSDDARFLKVRLVRARNQVVHALEQSLQALQRIDALDTDFSPAG
ncbi:MAG: M28 family peptidase [Chloroflexota bacterium]